MAFMRDTLHRESWRLRRIWQKAVFGKRGFPNRASHLDGVQTGYIWRYANSYIAIRIENGRVNRRDRDADTTKRQSCEAFGEEFCAGCICSALEDL